MPNHYISPKERHSNATRLPLLTYDKQISFRRGLQHDGMQPVDLRMKKSHNFAWFQREMFVCGTRKRNKLLNLDCWSRETRTWGCTRCILAEQLLQIWSLNVPKTPAQFGSLAGAARPAVCLLSYPSFKVSTCFASAWTGEAGAATSCHTQIQV